jgi:hypothetical protein
MERKGIIEFTVLCRSTFEVVEDEVKVFELFGGVEISVKPKESRKATQIYIKASFLSPPLGWMGDTQQTVHLQDYNIMASRGLKSTALFICDIQERFRGAIYEYPALIKLTSSQFTVNEQDSEQNAEGIQNPQHARLRNHSKCTYCP